jgi:uncharacterized coiled-coil protein SlyX
MKSIFYVLVLATVFTFGCNQKEKQEIARLSSENQALKTQSMVKDSSINDILQSMNSIEGNLSVIKEKESVISVKSSGNTEMTPDVRSRINDDIKVINELMAKNKKDIGRLRKQLKDSNIKIEEFQKMIDQLNQQIVERDTQIASLKEDLSKMHFSIESLNASMDTLKNDKAKLQANVEDKVTNLNTAYYVTGNKKQLIADNIIAKTGGFIGLGKTNQLKQNFNDSKFTKVDIRTLSEIAVNSKKYQIVTTHPSNSYQVETNKNGIAEKIKITNPEKFWSASKYLVVVID